MFENLDDLHKKSDEDINMYYGGNPKNIFVDKNNNEIITYTYNSIETEEKDSIQVSSNILVKEFIEGTVVSIFFYKKWRVCTSSFLDASECYWKSSKSILELVQECVDDWESFLSSLDKTFLYMYTLVHHDNIHLIDYTYRYGEKYKILDLFMKRNLESQQSEMIHNELITLSNLDKWNEEDKILKRSSLLKHAGLIVFEQEQNVLSKILTDAYKMVAINKKFRQVDTFSFYKPII